MLWGRSWLYIFSAFPVSASILGTYSLNNTQRRELKLGNFGGDRELSPVTDLFPRWGDLG